MSGSNYVKDCYQVETETAAERYEASLSQPVSVRLNLRALAMIEGITQRFGSSRSSIVSHAVDDFVREAFEELTPQDRLDVAKIADDFIQLAHEKDGQKGSVYTTSDGKPYRPITGYAEVLNQSDSRGEEKAA